MVAAILAIEIERVGEGPLAYARGTARCAPDALTSRPTLKIFIRGDESRIKKRSSPVYSQKSKKLSHEFHELSRMIRKNIGFDNWFSKRWLRQLVGTAGPAKGAQKLFIDS
ncbi:MAG: hypothetical protein ACR2L2_13425 [Acidobacteriota bacterium]